MDKETKAMIARVTALESKSQRLTEALLSLSDYNIVKASSIEEEFYKKNSKLLGFFNKENIDIIEYLDSSLALYDKYIKKVNKTIKQVSL